MTEALIVSAVRTPIATSYTGSLRDTSPEDLAAIVVREAAARSGLEPDAFEDVILAESLAGGGDIARWAALAHGMTRVPGQSVNRHCAGSLTAVGNAAASIRAGMDSAIIAGGTHSYSMNPTLSSRVPGQAEPVVGIRPTLPYNAGATADVTLSVGWNVAQAAANPPPGVSPGMTGAGRGGERSVQ